jgi:hypothetical protein
MISILYAMYWFRRYVEPSPLGSRGDILLIIVILQSRFVGDTTCSWVSLCEHREEEEVADGEEGICFRKKHIQLLKVEREDKRVEMAGSGRGQHSVGPRVERIVWRFLSSEA